MSKTRIYDLAKEYGMVGKDLAAKLKDMGFTQVKSHMTALDDFEVLEVQAKLEAYGIISPTAKKEESGEDLGGGLIVRRKKKGPTKEAAPKAPAPEPEDSEEPEPVAEAAPVVEAAPVAEPTPEPEAPVEVEAEEPAPVAKKPSVVEPAAVEPEAPVAADPTPAEPVAEVEAPVAEVAEPQADAPKDEVKPAAKDKTAKKKAGEEDSKEPKGKVVGFIDLSTIKTHNPKRPESRRLRGQNEYFVPNVQPTFGKKGRGAPRAEGGERDGLTAQQLRDRESSRFLRRRGPTTQRGGAGGGGRRGGSSRRIDHSGSPFAGKTVDIEEPISVRKLAEVMSVKGAELLRVAFKLLGFGQVNITSLIDADTAELLANEFEVELNITQEVAAEEALIQRLTDERDAVEERHLIARSPAVAFLGHVDHGKTTLIDTIRKSRIASGESGGITQHLGAYRVTTKLGHELCVIDTPGHAAFTAMRSRGASAVDVVVLVVAADDGVMPQTREAVDHAKAAGAPIIVAINKCDRPEANPEKVRNELSSFGLIPEEWGGSTAMLEVSALTGDGVEELLERVFLESEVLELRATDEGPASGIVLEAEIQQGKGKVAHLLVQDGMLKRGDVILAGQG